MITCLGDGNHTKGRGVVVVLVVAVVGMCEKVNRKKKQADRQIQAGRQTDREAQTDTERQTGRETDRYREPDRHRQTERQTYTQTDGLCWWRKVRVTIRYCKSLMLLVNLLLVLCSPLGVGPTDSTLQHYKSMASIGHYGPWEDEGRGEQHRGGEWDHIYFNCKSAPFKRNPPSVHTDCVYVVHRWPDMLSKWLKNFNEWTRTMTSWICAPYFPHLRCVLTAVGATTNIYYLHLLLCRQIHWVLFVCICMCRDFVNFELTNSANKLPVLKYSKVNNGAVAILLQWFTKTFPRWHLTGQHQRFSLLAIKVSTEES